MKRILLCILACFYLGISSGATVHFHYCMGQLVKLGLSAPQKTPCPFCGMEKKEASKKSCCKDDYTQAKVDQSQKTDPVQHQFQPLCPVLSPASDWKSCVAVLPIESHSINLKNAPPEKEPVPVFIRNCTYRI